MDLNIPHKTLSLDLAGKTGWTLSQSAPHKSDSEITKDNPVNFLFEKKGKFITKGKNEKEKVVDLFKQLITLLKELKDEGITDIIFEDSFMGSSFTSAKTLRATYGKRYAAIGIIGIMFPSVSLYCVSPSKWWKKVPIEYQLSKVDKKKDGTPDKAKGKEKKQNSLNGINERFGLELEWHNEGVKCDNDIADSAWINYLHANGFLIEVEELIG